MINQFFSEIFNEGNKKMQEPLKIDFFIMKTAAELALLYY